MSRSNSSHYLEHPSYSENENVYVVEDKVLQLEVAREAARSCDQDEDWDESIFISDIGIMFSQLKKFQSSFPQVNLFYTVSSNPLQPVIRTLAALGTGFCCVSKAEIGLVLECGAEPSKILFANPCKHISHICYARDNDVTLMTVDNEEELKKIKLHFPGTQLLLRIKPFESDIKQKKEKLFGSTLFDARELLKRAADFGLDMIGLSFDRDCWKTEDFKKTIDSAKDLFDFAKTLGYNFTMLDIGQGFLESVDGKEMTLSKMSTVTDNALNEHFPSATGVKIIAQPGRFFTQSAYWLVTNVIAKKVVQARKAYFVGENVYGAFNNTKWKNEIPEVTRLYPSAVDSAKQPSMIYGDSLSGEDVILSKAVISEIDVGDWLIWKNAGNFAAIRPHTGFNGFLTYKSLHYINESVKKELQDSAEEIALLPKFVKTL